MAGWVAAEPELLRRGTRARRSGGDCVSDQVREVSVHDGAGTREAGDCVSDEVGGRRPDERRISRRGSSLAEPSCGGRGAVTTIVEPTEELRSDGRVMAAEPELLWRARGFAGAGGDCVSEEVLDGNPQPDTQHAPFPSYAWLPVSGR